MTKQSVRAQVIERRTYLRPTDTNGTTFETPEQAWRRVIAHQQWLWERAKGAPLNDAELAELEELYTLFMDRKVTVSGRTRWLGGTDIAKSREASQFNCSFGVVQTVHDVVDTIWLLLQGCGVGFTANIGVLNGFTAPVELEIIRSTKVLERDADGNAISDPALKGNPKNVETFNKKTGVWKIVVGDSAEAWAKFFGKLLAFKGRAKKLIVDFSQIRPGGYRLSGYGWISSGDAQISIAVAGIVSVMNRASGKLLTAIDILDIENHLGTILSSRRSAEIALYEYGGPEWEEFATAKKDHFLKPETIHRAMSNNSLIFYQKPTRRDLKKVFKLMEEAGGSEPGFINGKEARRRAPYFKGVNPCAEILLGDKSFCNLVETMLSRFNGDLKGLHRAHYLIARANYRQTCVNLDDGILQRTWHELNDFLRLCGVGVTGVIGWEHVDNAEEWENLRDTAHAGANGMADELGMPRPALITTSKPSGTQSKVSGLEGDELGEGVHKPLGRYIFNNVNFSKDDPLVAILQDANYHIIENPYDATGRIVRFPVEYNNMAFDKVTKVVNGKETVVEVNLESAVRQLDRYKMLQDHYVDHNCSVTISYSLDEVPEIIDWLMDNWDSYVGVSFIYRNDPTKTAADLGYAYLPQEVVDEETFLSYKAGLGVVDLSKTDTGEMVDLDDCTTGACPIR
jgi:ribonucleoside-triphosphate reductase (formate)